MGQLQTPSPTHAEFDQLTEPVDEWIYLPAYRAVPEELGPDEDRDETELDELILAGLVCPV